MQRRTREEVQQETVKREHERQYYCLGAQEDVGSCSELDPLFGEDQSVGQEDTQMGDDWA